MANNKDTFSVSPPLPFGKGLGDGLQSFQDYLQLEKKYSNHTLSAYAKDISSFADFIKNNFDQEEINKVNYSQIRSWIIELSEKGISNSSINRKMQSLKAYYKFLLKIKEIEVVSPMLKHKALKVSKILQIPFSENEVEKVLNQIQNPTSFEKVRNKLIIDLFYSTGIRRTELIHIKVQNIDVFKNELKVLGKRNKERIIPILPTISQQITPYLTLRSNLDTINDTDYFFLTKKGTKLNDSFVYRLINSYFSAVSQKVKKSPHIIRHSFATHLLNNGADLNSVKELLGHSSLASTQVYTHSSLTALKKVYQEAHPRNQKN